MFKIKICGLTNPSDALTALDAGADAIGLNFYSPSVRSVSLEQAEEIARQIRTQSQNAASQPKLVGVFVNHSIEEIRQTAATVGLDIIQLHGDESPDFASELQRQMQEPAPAMIRAIRIGKDLAGAINPNALSREVDRWAEVGIKMVLLDAAVPGTYGGTGHAVDWNAVGNMELNLPVVLAGGLTEGNVAAAIEIAKPDAVDVASGVELSNHRKDSSLVRRFVANADAAFRVG